jgi:hypothetical protein
MQFLDKFRKKNQDEPPPPRKRAPRRGSTAGLLQPEDDIGADSKARRYDKRAGPRVSDILTNSLSTSLALAEGLKESLPSVTSSKRASDGGASLAPSNLLSSLTPDMFCGPNARRVGLDEMQPDARWSTVEDDLGGSGIFSLDDGDFRENENKLTKTRASFQIPETTTESSQEREASFAPQFDPPSTTSTGFDSSLLGPADTFVDFGKATPSPPTTTAKASSPTLAFESSQEGAAFADFQEFGKAALPPLTTTAKASSPTLAFELSQEGAAFADFQEFGKAALPPLTTAAKASSPTLAFESSQEGAAFADFQEFGKAALPPLTTTAKASSSPTLAFESSQEGAAFADFQEYENETKETRASFDIPKTSAESSQVRIFDSQEPTGFVLGPDTFTDFDHIAPRESTTAQAPSPMLAFESSQQESVFADFDSTITREKQVTAAEFEQKSMITLEDLKSSDAADPVFTSYQHSGSSLSYFEGPESFVQFDPNSSKPRVCSVADS